MLAPERRLWTPGGFGPCAPKRRCAIYVHYHLQLSKRSSSIAARTCTQDEEGVLEQGPPCWRAHLTVRPRCAVYRPCSAGCVSLFSLCPAPDPVTRPSA